MNRIRWIAVMVVIFILLIQWALPGAARADMFPIGELADEVVPRAVILLPLFLLLTLIIEVPIVTLPLRRAMTSIGAFAILVLMVNLCTYLFGLVLLSVDTLLVIFFAPLFPDLTEPSSLFLLYVGVEVVVTLIEIAWIGAIAKRRLIPRAEAPRQATVATVERLVVLANLVTAALGLAFINTDLAGWLLRVRGVI